MLLTPGEAAFMANVTIDLYADWLNTVKEVFRGSGFPLPDDLSEQEIGLAYYIQTAVSENDAETLRAANEKRLRDIERTIQDNLETIIVPDIRKRTGYSENRFKFKWVYAGGEHIVEECSSYRIPLE
jgi:hypothetical protein